MAINANYMTLSPLYLINNSYPPSTSYVIDGNLTVLNATSNYGIGMTHGFYSGKWYWEILLADKGQFLMGFITVDTFNGQKSQPHNKTGSYLVYTSTAAQGNQGYKVEETSFITINNFNAGDGDIVGFALDRDSRKLWVSLNGTFINSGNPAGGSNPVFDSGDITATTGEFRPIIGTYGGQSVKMTLNAGQDSSFVGQKTSGSASATDDNGFGDFYYTPPTGFLSACQNNIPTSDDIDPAGDDGADENPTKQFNTVLWTGDGNNNRSVTGVGFKPDLLWGKVRSSADEHFLYDSSRGSNRLLPSTSDAESDYSAYWSQFDNDGWTFGNNASSQNLSSATFVGWCWKANGGVTSSNTDGSITSTVQANTKAGFSICTYTGNGSNGATFGHGLSAKPSFVIIKNRDASQKWAVWHQSIEQNDNKLLFLDTNAGLTTEGTQRWDVSAISSSVFGLGSHPEINGSGADYVSYIWHDVEGYSKFGFYDSNDNADGPFQYTGFRPRMVFIKMLVTGDGWGVWDSARYPNNPIYKIVQWNLSNAESTLASGYFDVDFLSNGFKIRASNAQINSTSYDPYIWGAWGDVPFKYNNTF